MYYSFIFVFISSQKLWYTLVLHNFKRFYAVREDSFWRPNHLELGLNIKYLYHRWQWEFTPPFDYLFTELFHHPEPRETSIHGDSNNVQSMVPTSILSGYDVYPRPPESLYVNWGGGADGHGEIVGFRGTIFDVNPGFSIWPDHSRLWNKHTW